MREFPVSELVAPIREMCIKANRVLPEDVRKCLKAARACETSAIGAAALDDILQNMKIAEDDQVPMCQDTGMALVFVELGQEVHLLGDLEQAVNEGVRQGYAEGYLRKSIVRDPLRRENTRDNTPAMLYLKLVPGDKIKLTVAPKGFGSENMSRQKMLKPSDGLEGVKAFILETVREAGPNPCPPTVVGVGIGGNFDKSCLLAKEALLRELGQHNPDPYYAGLEQELLESINRLGIGPQGYGGLTTALAVHIEVLPTHIAGLPVAVNINCHATRHVTEVL